jgi:lysophospholipase L1-like esterase
LLFVFALLALLSNRLIAPDIRRDWLNFIPALATLYLGYSVIALDKVLGHATFVRRRLDAEARSGKPVGSFLVSPWFRSAVLIVLLLVTVEFALRTRSYHRALLYERQGNLLFTPIPNQEYTEKVSLSSSKINDLGLRGGPVDLSRGTKKILALGDSVTYGYGLDDDHTYPAMLQKALDRKFPQQYTVLNGGVNAYPVSFEHQKFLYLWEKGLHPDILIVGYSFNEGRLGHLVGSDDRTKSEFAHRVRVKNTLRTIALYNLIVENWARRAYDKMTSNLVPGTNFVTLSQEDVDIVYGRQLEDFVSDLRTRNVKPIFLLFCGYDARVNNYDDAGPFQKVFRNFAERQGLPLLRSRQALLKDESVTTDLHPYFQDLSHMKPTGTARVGEMIADTLPQLSRRSPASGPSSSIQ